MELRRCLFMYEHCVFYDSDILGAGHVYSFRKLGCCNFPVDTSWLQLSVNGCVFGTQAR